MTEFNLSDKIFKEELGDWVVNIEDVKEFIKRIKFILHDRTLYEGGSIKKIIDGEAGDKLV